MKGSGPLLGDPEQLIYERSSDDTKSWSVSNCNAL